MKSQLIDQNVERATTAFKILADPTRFKILCLFMSAPEGLCVYEVAEGVGISHSAASHQLAKLEAHNVVEAYREGQTVCYEMCDTVISENLRLLMKPFTKR